MIDFRGTQVSPLLLRYHSKEFNTEPYNEKKDHAYEAAYGSTHSRQKHWIFHDIFEHLMITFRYVEADLIIIAAFR